MRKTAQEDLGGEQLICAECAHESPPQFHDWRIYYLLEEDQPVPFCPECAQREFGAPGVAVELSPS